MPGYTSSPKKNIIYACIVCMVFFCLLELSGRIALALLYETPRYFLYGFLPQVRFRPVRVSPPFVDYYKGIPSRSRENPVNSMGFRGPEIIPEKKGFLRVLCLGASTTYGDNHVYHDTYPALLQEKLQRASGGIRYEVINAGQPGFDLNHIISFVNNEGLSLKPDIVVLLSVNNNFKAPGFWFVRIAREEQGDAPVNANVRSGKSIPTRLKERIVRYSAIGRLWENFMMRGWLRYTAEFDWQAFAQLLISEDNIWEDEYRRNLQRLIALISSVNPDTRILLLEQAVNTINFPYLAGPWGKAWQIMRETAGIYPNVYVLDVHAPLINAAVKGVPVWQDKDLRDPLHLSQPGNDVMADCVVDFVKTIVGD